jgi:hypothetical protein
MLNVTLDKTTNPWTVDVDQHNNANEFSRSPNTQTITWQLTGNAASGSFVPMSDPNPGFSWVSAPPTGIFSYPPTISGNGNTMTMTDLNNSTTTAGTWTYILRVNVGGTVYCTETTSITATNTDPTIKNH